MFANDFNRVNTKYALCEYFVNEIDSIIFAYSRKVLYRCNKSYLRHKIVFYFILRALVSTLSVRC